MRCTMLKGTGSRVHRETIADLVDITKANLDKY